jgi:hypothetical protein
MCLPLEAELRNTKKLARKRYLVLLRQPTGTKMRRAWHQWRVPTSSNRGFRAIGTRKLQRNCGYLIRELGMEVTSPRL